MLNPNAFSQAKAARPNSLCLEIFSYKPKLLSCQILQDHHRVKGFWRIKWQWMAFPCPLKMPPTLWMSITHSPPHQQRFSWDEGPHLEPLCCRKGWDGISPRLPSGPTKLTLGWNCQREKTHNFRDCNLQMLWMTAELPRYTLLFPCVSHSRLCCFSESQMWGHGPPALWHFAVLLWSLFCN